VDELLGACDLFGEDAGPFVGSILMKYFEDYHISIDTGFDIFEYLMDAHWRALETRGQNTADAETLIAKYEVLVPDLAYRPLVSHYVKNEGIHRSSLLPLIHKWMHMHTAIRGACTATPPHTPCFL